MIRAATDRPDRAQMRGSSMSLWKISKALEEKHGIPMQEQRSLHRGVLQQIERIVRQAGEPAFAEGYRQGCISGVAAVKSDDHWSFVRIPRRSMLCGAIGRNVAMGQQKIVPEDVKDLA